MLTVPDFLFITWLKALGAFEVLYLGWLLSKRLGPLMCRSHVPPWVWTVVALAQFDLGLLVAVAGPGQGALYFGVAIALSGVLVAAADHYRREHEQTRELAAQPARR